MTDNISPGRKVNIDELLRDFPFEIIRKKLIHWWRSSGQRHFPWRETRDPYKILVAEILLHRTKADQVVPLYKAFLEKYPDIHSIAQSSPDKLAKSFYSAGLSWRWKLLHSMACEIDKKYLGKIPDNFNELTSLPGVSHYIASAIRCFAFGYPDVLLDTNTVRVAGRIFGLPITDSSRRSQLFRKALEQFIDIKRPREFNFSLIDFAAKICRAKAPVHQNCPVCEFCYFYQDNVISKQNNESRHLQNRDH